MPKPPQGPGERSHLQWGHRAGAGSWCREVRFRARHAGGEVRPWEEHWGRQVWEAGAGWMQELNLRNRL